MAASAARMPGAQYLMNLAESHANAKGFEFDESGRTAFTQVAEQGLETAHQNDIFTVEDVQMKVAPNTVKLTDAIIGFAEGILLTARAVKNGLQSICPIFPFC